jgi:hypothetical protein
MDPELTSVGGFLFLVLGFVCLLWDDETMTTTEVRIRSSPLYPQYGGAPSANEGVWSHMSGGSPGIRSVFVIVGVVSCQPLPIYSSYDW